MSTVIRFLEQMGGNAKLRHAESAELEVAMMHAGIDAPSRSAILASDERGLAATIGAQSNVCAIIFPVEPSDDDGDDRKIRRLASVR
jgi:hypothetical protein